MRYAFILKFAYISIAYGFALPILFPISFVAMLNMYVTDRLALVYIYKDPPKIDNKITLRAIKILKYPTTIGIFVSFWAAGNQQLFSH